MRLAVSGLPAEYDKRALMTLFAKYGWVKFVSVGLDGITMKSTRRGTVVMDDERQAKAALDGLNGKDIGGAIPLHIKVIKEQRY